MRLLLLPALFLLVPAAAAQDDPRAAVEASNRAFMDAYAAGDAAGVAALYTPDTRLYAPNMPPLEGREAVQAWMQGGLDMGLTRLDFVTDEVYAVSDDMAQEYGRFTLYAGDQAVDEGRYAVLWKRDGDRWMLHRDVFNSSRPAPEPEGE